MGKVLLCRCEDVTWVEVDRAIAEGHDDLESLKRITGLGTGYCQGKSCVAAAVCALRARGAAVSAPFTVRPPLQPTAFGALAALCDQVDEDERSGREPH